MFTVVPVALYGAISCLNANYGVGQAMGGSALTLNRYIGDSSAPLANPVEVSSSPFVATPSQTPAPPNNPPDTAIDILVIYNEATRAHFDPNGGKAATVAFAQYCVDTTQQAMDLSTAGWQPGQTPIATVNLVAAKEVAGPPSPQLIFDYQQYAERDLEPMGLRNLYAADAVVYLVENGINAYGVSSIPGSTPPGGTPLPPPGPGFAPLAISVVQRNTAVNDDTGFFPQEPYVFPHEFAHLIGANHDVTNAGNNTTPLQPYAYGHYAAHAEGGARTIMSYYPQNGCQAPCTRVLNYSNPAVFGPADLGLDWFRTGIAATADNALVIAELVLYGAVSPEPRSHLLRRVRQLSGATMHFLRALLGVILIAATAETARAQIVLPSDVGVAMIASPTTNLQPGQPIDMTLTVTNYGPAAVPDLFLLSSVFVDEMYFVSVNTAECYFVTSVVDLANGYEFFVEWNVAGLGLPPFQPGSATCHFQIALTRKAPPIYHFSFGLLPSFEFDPNPANNIATVTLQRAPPPAPVAAPALSPAMLALLAGLLAATAWVARRGLST